MNDLVKEVQRQLWDPAGIDLQQMEGLMGRLMSPSVDIGELFFQRQKSQSWSLEDGIVKDGSFSVDQGVGVRAVSGEKTGFAYAEDIVMPALQSATDAARCIARQGQQRQTQAWRAVELVSRYGQATPSPRCLTPTKWPCSPTSMPWRVPQTREFPRSTSGYRPTTSPCW